MVYYKCDEDDKFKMKNFKIYAVSGEDNSKYEISLNELVQKVIIQMKRFVSC